MPGGLVRSRNWSASRNADSRAAIRSRMMHWTFSKSFQPADRHWPEIEFLDENFVLVARRIWSRQEFLTDKDRICSGHEAQADRFAAEGAPPGAQAHARRRHQDARCRDRPDQDKRINRFRFAQRSAGNANEHVDRDTFRMRLQSRQLVQ